MHDPDIERLDFMLKTKQVQVGTQISSLDLSQEPTPWVH